MWDFYNNFLSFAPDSLLPTSQLDYSPKHTSCEIKPQHRCGVTPRQVFTWVLTISDIFDDNPQHPYHPTRTLANILYRAA